MNEVWFKSGTTIIGRVPFNNDGVYWENGGSPVTVTNVEVSLHVMGQHDIVREVTSDCRLDLVPAIPSRCMDLSSS